MMEADAVLVNVKTKHRVNVRRRLLFEVWIML
jgi:hypothetical protein